MKLTQKYLKSILAYDAETGLFIWRETRGSVSAGRKAGGACGPYVQIRIDMKFYKAHRLAWLYVYGVMPKFRIDHRDNVQSNNRILNLRRATHSQNMANRKLNKNNRLGFKGVIEKRGRFYSYINKDGKRSWLGGHLTPAEAHQAYLAAAKMFHGEFARSS